MSDWPFVEIRTLIENGTITIHKDGNHGANYPRAEEFVAEGLPFLTAKSLSDGQVDIAGAPRLSKIKAASFRFGFVRTGDVLLSHNATVGRVAIMPRYDGEAVIGTSLTQFRLDQSRMLSDFLAYYFVSEEFQNALSFVMSYSTRNQVPITEQRKLKVRVPDIETQQQIVSIIQPLQRKIDLNRHIAATLEEMARALYRSWFVDFDPVKAKAEGMAPAFMDEATAALFPDRFGDDGLPEGWGMMPLSSLCVQVKDSIDPRKNTDRMFDHYSLPAFDAGKGPVREPGSAIQSQKLRIPTEAILFSRLNPTTPRIWWARTSDQVFASVASTEYLVAVSRIKGDMPFLYSLLVSDEFRGNVIARVTGTSNSHQRVKPGSVLDIEVVGATDEIRGAYGAVTAPWFDRVDDLGKENRALADLRDSLLPKLMSGELRVGEARDQIEEVA